ncbi:fungal-specific transcription factor domain-containing protein [Xylaria bambusicola]|uniref:fungal-specific transcription factor domain-containing protein n=1 Tax=Xylaria bambusicola TaxID=326684 RepID=UPI002007E8D0|nr:fungal-specific transcription factor domain-containing protein [Xylaria bambusicola]KAI0517430.1 fungal-specific transcription factor domain-containing protein [Xylaria bambusicola]
MHTHTPPPKRFTRTKTGCWTCRDDGHKCEEQKPFCGRCVRLGKHCEYGVRPIWKAPMTPEQIAQDSKELSQTRRQKYASKALARRQSQRHPASSVSPRAMSSGIPLQEAYLLHHWKTNLASLITLAPSAQNPFNAYITPMIPDSLSLRSSICSMAAFHLSVLKDDPSLLTIATQHQIKAISLFRQIVDTGDVARPSVSLAINMILHITDRLFSPSPGAIHLGGAKGIVERAGPNFWDSDASRFLLGCCSYHDSMVSAFDRTPPVMSLGPDAPYREQMKPIRALRVLWETVGRISSMSRLGGYLLYGKGEDIECTLWAIDRLTICEEDEGHTIHAYTEAAFIYLYQVWHELPSPHPTNTIRAKTCLRHLCQVDVSSPLVAAQPWPLWIAACETTDSELRDLVRKRVKAMYEYRHLPSLRRLEQDIETAWKITDKDKLLLNQVDCFQTTTPRHIAKL